MMNFFNRRKTNSTTGPQDVHKAGLTGRVADLEAEIRSLKRQMKDLDGIIEDNALRTRRSLERLRALLKPRSGGKFAPSGNDNAEMRPPAPKPSRKPTHDEIRAEILRLRGGQR